MQTTREMQNACPNQANSQAGTKWPISQKEKERTHGEKEAEKREKTTTTLSEKKEEASNVIEQRDKGWIHVIRVHDTIHLAMTTTRQGNRRSRTTPHKERMCGLFKHRDYPPSLVHRKWTIYLEKQKGKPREKTRQWMARTGNYSPTPNPNSGRPRNR